MLGPIGSAVLGPNETAGSGEHTASGTHLRSEGAFALPAQELVPGNYPKGRSADASS
jgi:hypothetical protein